MLNTWLLFFQHDGFKLCIKNMFHHICQISLSTFQRKGIDHPVLKDTPPKEGKFEPDNLTWENTYVSIDIVVISKTGRWNTPNTFFRKSNGWEIHNAISKRRKQCSCKTTLYKFPSFGGVPFRAGWCKSISIIVFIMLCTTFCSYKKLAISDTKTVCHHWTWYEAQSFI